jgi:hypothetical protein
MSGTPGGHSAPFAAHFRSVKSKVRFGEVAETNRRAACAPRIGKPRQSEAGTLIAHNQTKSFFADRFTGVFHFAVFDLADSAVERCPPDRMRKAGHMTQDYQIRNSKRSSFRCRLRIRLVSLISISLSAKEGRCEIRRQGCSLEVNQRARRSSIRTCPWMVLKLEQLLERPGCSPGGADSLASSHLQAGVI